MKYRKLGNTDMEVSAVCLGSWVFGGDCWGDVEDLQSVQVVKEAIENGINFIDTAPVYGSGRSEKVIGRVLSKADEKIFVATKCGLEIEGKAIRPNLTKEFIREEIENSLKRLNVETVDLYQCHWPDPNTPMEESFGELNALVGEGKIKHIGVSNFSEEQLAEALTFSNVVSNQVQYSLLDREIEEDLIPFCGEKGVSILSYGPLGGGILTGKYKELPQVSKGDVKSFFYKFYREPFWSQARGLVDVLDDIADEHGVPTSQVAMNWVLSRSEVGSCIVGCRSSDQLKSNIAASDWELSTEELERIPQI
ncbi:MAG: aldo/keto reductase [Candidatus Tantalella remota]|nr:aldo/keto reductase [Candidatus Tantalella remota]